MHVTDSLTHSNPAISAHEIRISKNAAGNDEQHAELQLHKAGQNRLVFSSHHTNQFMRINTLTL